MVNRLLLLTLGTLLFGWSMGAWAALTATLSQTEIGPNDQVTLTLQSDSNQPVDSIDLSVLDADFLLGGRSTSSQISFMNGQQTAVREVRVELTPRREGDFTIPAFSLNGESSQALTLKVSASASAAAGAVVSGDEPIVMDASVDQTAVYVQQQVIYTLKLYFALNITDGAIDELKIDGAVVERLGTDLRSQTEINGQIYQVLERRYLVVPEKSGALEIPSLSLRARASSGSGGSMLDNFFDRGRAINVPSRAITLTVKPRPAAFTGSAWLPAKMLALEETLSTDGVRVGDAITRTIRLTARGLSAAQLPAIAMQRSAQFQIYPDQPSRVARLDGNDALATLEQKIAIIPAAAGAITLPAIEIPWWDVQADELRMAILPARTINVLPALTLAAPTSVAPTAEATMTLARRPDRLGSSALWQGMSAALLIVALSAIWRIRQLGRRLKLLERPSAASTFQPSPADLELASSELRRAITSGDEAAASRALVSLARARGMTVTTLNEVGPGLASDELRALVFALERSRFSPNAKRTDLSPLKEALKASAWLARSATTDGASAVIAPLYR